MNKKYLLVVIVIAILLIAGGIGYAVSRGTVASPENKGKPSSLASPSTSVAGGGGGPAGTSGDQNGLSGSGLCGALTSSEQTAIFGDATIINSRVGEVPPTSAFSKFCYFYYLVKAGGNQIQFNGTVSKCTVGSNCDAFRTIIKATLQDSRATSLGIGDVSSYVAVTGAGGILNSAGDAVYNRDSGYVVSAKLAQKTAGADAAYNLRTAQQFTKIMEQRF